MPKGIFVPLETLELWLHRMEADWYQIDSEWGSGCGGLEEAVCNGDAPEIAQLRETIRQVKADTKEVL